MTHLKTIIIHCIFIFSIYVIFFLLFIYNIGYQSKTLLFDIQMFEIIEILTFKIYILF